MEEVVSKHEAIAGLADEVSALMEDLFQSGFETVHDGTLLGMERAAERTGQYGMQYLSELLKELAGEISMGRHQMKRRTAQIAALYADVNEYLYICRQKAAYDRGKEYYLS